MLPAALTPRRKWALAFSLPWLVISYGALFYAMNNGTDPACLLLRLPFAATAGLTLAFALSGDIIITEMLRLVIPSSTAWSEKRHFALALTIAAASLAVQWFTLVLAEQRSAHAF